MDIVLAAIQLATALAGLIAAVLAIPKTRGTRRKKKRRR